MKRFRVTLEDARTHEQDVMPAFYADDAIQARLWSRRMWARERGEEYSPQVHKVVDVVELDARQGEMF